MKLISHIAEYSHIAIESEEESEEEEEEEEEEEAEKPAANVPADGLETPSGLATPSGYHSVVSTVPGGLETPDFMDLRKNTKAQAEDVPSGPRSCTRLSPKGKPPLGALWEVRQLMISVLWARVVDLQCWAAKIAAER